MKRTVIIGAGIGGLSCGALLAAKGVPVIVFEKEARPGGYCQSFQDHGYLFDACVDTVGCLRRGALLHTILQNIGIAETLDLIELYPVRRNIFPGFSVDIPPDTYRYQENLTALFPGQKKEIEKIFAAMEEIYEQSLAAILDDTAAAGLGAWAGKTYKAFLDAYISESRLGGVLSSYCTFLGMPAKEVSAIAAVNILMHYLKGGAFRVRGGLQKLIDALCQSIRRNKGEVLLNEPVQKIITEDGNVKGVLTKAGHAVTADTVISAMDAITLINSLMDPGAIQHELRNRISALKVSSSFYIVYLGLDCDLNRYPLVSSMGYFSSLDTDAMFNCDGRACFGISIPSLMDPSVAPAGCSTMIIHWPQGHSESIPLNGDAVSERIIKELELFLPGISRYIVYRQTANPQTLQCYTGNSNGAAYGWEQNAGFSSGRALFKNIADGLYCVGHWAGYGGGVMPSMISAAKVAAMVTGAMEGGEGMRWMK